MRHDRDYTQAGLYFQVKKTLRYVRLFGLSRTMVKIKGQYHMKARAGFDDGRWINPTCKSPDADNRTVALIGCGNYAFSNIAYYLSKQNSDFLRCCYTPGRSRAKSLCKAYGGAYATSDWREILTDSQVRTVFIASDHTSHADYAVACIEAGKNVHIEKPHVTTREQLERLVDAMKRNPESKVFLGFNRQRSPLFKRLQASLAKEPGSLMINWFVAAHHLPGDNVVLSHLCHWTDSSLHLVTMEKAFPCTVSATAHGESDVSVSIMFADRSCASITFSSKGHVFDGMREILQVHKGNVLARLADFNFLQIDVLNKRRVNRSLYRDHGHAANILNSQSGVGESWQYVSATGGLFLAVQESIATKMPVILTK